MPHASFALRNAKWLKARALLVSNVRITALWIGRSANYEVEGPHRSRGTASFRYTLRTLDSQIFMLVPNLL